MKILVAGGLGFIGSLTVVELLNDDYEVIIIENLHNSREETKNLISIITKKILYSVK